MLVTLVILSLALSTVTGALAASSSSYKTCRLEANAQTLLSTQINAIAGYLYTSTPIVENGTTLKCIYSEGVGYITFENSDGSDSQQKGIYLNYASDMAGLGTQKAESVPSVTKSTQPLDLYAQLMKNPDGSLITWNSKGKYYEFTVQIFSKDEQKTPLYSQLVHIRSELMP